MSEEKKSFFTNGGQKGMHLREMASGKVLINKPFSNKTKSTNRPKPKRRK